MPKTTDEILKGVGESTVPRLTRALNWCRGRTEVYVDELGPALGMPPAETLFFFQWLRFREVCVLYDRWEHPTFMEDRLWSSNPDPGSRLVAVFVTVLPLLPLHPQEEP